jgi:hypothetical protein
VSKKLKHREFHFSLGVLIRWIFFALIIYLSINYLSTNHPPTQLSNYSTKLNILGINTEPAVIKATATFEEYKKQVIKFANDQFTDIKKQVITKVYEEIIKNIDKSKK